MSTSLKYLDVVAIYVSFIEKQRHGKHHYYYVVKNVRVSPTKTKKIRIFLGREVPSHAELQRHLMELEKRSASGYDGKWLSKGLMGRLEDLRSSVAVFNKTPGEALPKDFLVRYTYNTNAIEGSKLTLRQTALVLSDRMAPEGARTEDVIEALNSSDAWEFVKKYKGKLDKKFVCKVQYELTKNTSCRIQGDYRDSDVRIIGSGHIPPRPSEVPALMQKLFEEYGRMKKELHPIELATLMHNKLVKIHPFTDGNGRTSRLLMNWILLRNRFPAVVIEVANKEKYYSCIEHADRGDQKHFSVFLAEQMLGQYTAVLPG
ncbi:MAG: Fic family protein [Candidatus Micrarchaeota archaeon]|nr:Fic family protein [Candidatus Micrarchaeota archaeon]